MDFRVGNIWRDYLDNKSQTVIESYTARIALYELLGDYSYANLWREFRLESDQ